jgi:hypothetical protein
VRFRSSGTLFARFKARGKLIRQSLEASDLESGKRKLDDLVQKERGAVESLRDGRLSLTEALEEFRARGYRVTITGRSRKRKPLKQRTRSDRIALARTQGRRRPGHESLRPLRDEHSANMAQKVTFKIGGAA